MLWKAKGTTNNPVSYSEFCLVWVFFWLESSGDSSGDSSLSWMSGDSSDNCHKEKLLSSAKVLLLWPLPEFQPPVPFPSVCPEELGERRQLLKNKDPSSKPTRGTTRGHSWVLFSSSAVFKGQQKPKEPHSDSSTNPHYGTAAAQPWCWRFCIPHLCCLL